MGKYQSARQRLLNERDEERPAEVEIELAKPASSERALARRTGPPVNKRKRSEEGRTLAKLARDLCALSPDSRPRILVLTSPGSGEGVSSVSRDLASALEDTGARRVLIVETDLRAHRSSEERGLAQVLADGENYETALSGDDGLRVLLSGGPVTTEPGKLFEGDAAKELFSRLREDYDFVLLDCAPVNEHPDASILGRQADATILVVESGHTTQGAAQEAIHRLETSGANVTGVILNRHHDPLPAWARSAL